jgi:hypothetical protein
VARVEGPLRVRSADGCARSSTTLRRRTGQAKQQLLDLTAQTVKLLSRLGARGVHGDRRSPRRPPRLFM